jgi:hypothetical protein
MWRRSEKRKKVSDRRVAYLNRVPMATGEEGSLSEEMRGGQLCVQRRDEREEEALGG